MRTNTKHHGFFLIAALSLITLVCITGAALSESLTVDQIVQKNIAARGGEQAWRAIQSMKLTGKMDVGGKDSAQLPFVLTLQRPRKSRLEIEFAESTAVQVYDGTNGWKIRPFLGRLQVEPYSTEERQIAAEQSELDGLLIDHDAKGIQVELAGEEPVENHNAYKLRLTMKDGQVRNLWLDAQTFLEVKIQGTPRKLDGKMHDVEVYYRDYRKVEGVTIPFLLETAVEKVKDVRKISFESVALNPILQKDAFLRPSVNGMNPATGLRLSSVQMSPANRKPLPNSVRDN